MNHQSADKPWSAFANDAANLGIGFPELVPSAGSRIQPDDSQKVEAWLKQYQLAIAAGFRFETPGVMNEVESLHSPQGNFATSDMPIFLHRAFNVPALIIEVGEPAVDGTGNPTTVSAQIRLVAPRGSALAATLKQAAENGMTLQANGETMKNLLANFSDLPVFWLEREHYSMFVPKSAMQ